MCDDEFAALVVDNDSGMCKTGLAGDDAQVVRNEFSCQAKVLNAAALNFLKNQEEITMITCQNRFVMKTFMEDTEDISIRTQYTLPSEDFEAYQVESRLNYI